MTNYLGKSCSFCLPRVPFVSCRRFVCLVISLFGFEGRICDMIVSVPDHCLSFYFVCLAEMLSYKTITITYWLTVHFGISVTSGVINKNKLYTLELLKYHNLNILNI